MLTKKNLKEKSKFYKQMKYKGRVKGEENDDSYKARTNWIYHKARKKVIFFLWLQQYDENSSELIIQNDDIPDGSPNFPAAFVFGTTGTPRSTKKGSFIHYGEEQHQVGATDEPPEGADATTAHQTRPYGTVTALDNVLAAFKYLQYFSF